MPGGVPATAPEGPNGISGKSAANNPKNPANLKPCTLTWYDPALGGINSSNGQANPHSTMANGKPYDASKYTCAADPSFAFGTNIYIESNGKDCVVEVTDRGGAITGAHFDLSRAAAAHLGIIKAGTAHGRYGVTSLAPGANNTTNVPAIVGSITSPFTDLVSLFNKIFSKQALYIAVGVVMLIVAVILIVMRTGPGKTAMALVPK